MKKVPSGTVRRISTTHIASLGMLGMLSVPAEAQTAEEPVSLGSVRVEAPMIVNGRKPEKVQSPKMTQPLRDTPQSVSVITGETMKEQNALSLQDVLKNVAGITFTSGEGNLGWGDFFTIRGFSSEQSVTVDGVRDGGMSSRTDIFNMQQAEVFKGTGSVESGVSAVGGSVNLVSKEAQAEDFYRGSFGLGSQNYRRATVDVNQKLTDTTAVRVNLMSHYNQVARRNEVDYERYGAAVSLATGLGTSTRLYLDGLHQRDDNTPDGGLPIQRGTGGQRMPGVPKDAWYGASNSYAQHTQVDSLTGKLEHDFSDATTIRTQARYERSDNWGVYSPARFTAADANGNKTCTGTRCATLGYAGLGGLTSVAGVSSYTDYTTIDTGAYGYLRGNDFGTSKRYEIYDSQTDIKTHFHTGGIKHDLTAGIELFREYYGDHERTMLAPAGDMFFDLANPQTVFATTTVTKGAGNARAKVESAGIYINDTITLADRWEVQAAIRADRFKAQSVTASRSDTAIGGRLGLVYKPVEAGAIYVSYSQAAQPSAVGLTTNNTIYGAAATSALKPAKSRTWEAGSKWDLMGGALSLTGAVFRTELSDSWEYNADDTSPVRALPSKRVDGFELEAHGEITPRWSIIASFSRLKSEITKGVNKGVEAANVPDWSGSLWTSYKLGSAVELSYGAQYVGHRRYSNNKYVGGLNNSASYAMGPSGVYAIYTLDEERAPSYIVQNAAVRWHVSDNVTANLNVQNLTNRFYWSRIGASLDGFQLYGIPGAGRTVTGSVDFAF
ncbi:TonB-dependent siderophore receptor [Novosphingobium resinovorum]|uniref:TonB-dependent receptor n=1 Tax=Novosphingobium TaxID=165696 RepID=UPI001B3C4F3C|nr:MULTISPECIES: TonB-dependent siderophore receptor [Novosphingobium]MBF7013354.1 TonB-dependent siderophore receptor [Novosphingobium sp. HR1a]WJM25505.1 TonB-dependent siderophore receptor [Novosphingobium resinovorum]